MGELAQAQIGDGDEVGRRSEAACGAFGLLHQPVHGFDEGVAAVIEHASHDRVEVGLERGGQPFEGLGLTGYDNVKGEYQSIWLDNMMTGMMYGTGSFDAAKKTVKVSGNFSCPMTGDKNRWYRYEWKVIDNDHHSYISYSKSPNGKEFKEMEISFTRAK